MYYTHNNATTLQPANPLLEPRRALLSVHRLLDENRRFRGTGGVSEKNRQQGFAPAYRDPASGQIYLSRFADGRPAPIHVLEGLPDHMLTRSPLTGHITSTACLLESGFVRQGRFYSRSEAAAALAESPQVAGARQ